MLSLSLRKVEILRHSPVTVKLCLYQLQSSEDVALDLSRKKEIARDKQKKREDPSKELRWVVSKFSVHGTVIPFSAISLRPDLEQRVPTPCAQCLPRWVHSETRHAILVASKLVHMLSRRTENIPAVAVVVIIPSEEEPSRF